MSDKVRMIYFAEYRARLDNPDQLVIHAGTNETYMEHAKIKAYIDGENVPVKAILRDIQGQDSAINGITLCFHANISLFLMFRKNSGKRKSLSHLHGRTKYIYRNTQYPAGASEKPDIQFRARWILCLKRIPISTLQAGVRIRIL